MSVFTLIHNLRIIPAIFILSLPLVVCWRAHVIFKSLCLFVHSTVQHVLTLWVTWRVSYKRQELHTLREHLGSPTWFLCCFYLYIILYLPIHNYILYCVHSLHTVYQWRQFVQRLYKIVFSEEDKTKQWNKTFFPIIDWFCLFI
jgi:hypothetical protein